MYSRGVSLGSSSSVRCWWYMPSFRWLCRFTMPSKASRSPVISFSSVDFPAPLGPTMATRLSRSTPRSTCKCQS